MGHSLRSSTLVPRGFVVYNTAIDDGVMLIAIRPATQQAFARSAEQGRNESTVDINDAWLTCRWWESLFGLSLMRDDSTATQCCAAGESSPSALTGTFSRLRRGELPGSTTSSIISDLLWVAGQRPPLPKGLCCP